MDYKLKRTAELTTVTLTGGIAEDAGPILTKLRKELEGSAAIRFDCAGVEAINSVGVRLWQQFLHSLRQISCEMVLCSVYFVDYANMSPILVAGTKVVSFYAPFRCPACNQSSEILLESSQIKNQSFGKQPCKTCSVPMKPEVDAGSYLAFLADTD